MIKWQEVLRKTMEKKGVHVAYIWAIQDMYERVTTSVKVPKGETKDFYIGMGLY